MKRVTHLFVPSLTGCLLVASLLSSCTGIHGPMPVPSAGEPQPDASGAEPPPTTRVQVGMASWYGKPFHGRTTASGEIYDMYQPTAAHLTAPLGTYALVTNLENGQSVRVRINDRGPYKRPRILDLSYEAARQIDMVRPGLGRVQIEFLAESALGRAAPGGTRLVQSRRICGVRPGGSCRAAHCYVSRHLTRSAQLRAGDRDAWNAACCRASWRLPGSEQRGVGAKDSDHHGSERLD